MSEIRDFRYFEHGIFDVFLGSNWYQYSGRQANQVEVRRLEMVLIKTVEVNRSPTRA